MQEKDRKECQSTSTTCSGWFIPSHHSNWLGLRIPSLPLRATSLSGNSPKKMKKCVYYQPKQISAQCICCYIFRLRHAMISIYICKHWTHSACISVLHASWKMKDLTNLMGLKDVKPLKASTGCCATEFISEGANQRYPIHSDTKQNIGKIG